MTRRKQVIDLGGEVHYVDHGGDGAPIVAVHGLGGSHLNWERLAPMLRSSHRVYALDLVGFGHTPLDGRTASLVTNRDLVLHFTKEIAGAPSTVIGNSMGGLVAMLAAATGPDLVERLVLIDPALPLYSLDTVHRDTLLSIAAPAIPGVGPALMRRAASSMTAEEQVDVGYDFVCSDPSRIDDDTRRQSIEMTHLRRSQPWAVAAFTQAAQSIARELVWRPKIWRTVHRIASPTLVIHGAQDRIVSPRAVTRLMEERPDWDLVMLEDVGHVPQLEAPELVAHHMLDWLGE